MTFQTSVITSVNNIKIKTFLKDEKFLLFEGEKLCNDLIAQRNFSSDIIICLSENRHLLHIPYPQHVKEIWAVTPQIMTRLSAMNSPPTLMVATLQKPEKIDFSKTRSVLALLNLQDPGNVGTLIRTASAFGIDGIAFIGSTVQLRNRKFLRSAQNAIFQIPISYFDEFSAFAAKCKKNHLTIYLSSSNTQHSPLDPEALIPPCAIVLGNEGTGFSTDLLAQYPAVRIPQSNRVESLNVSVSGSILMHELRKKWGYE